MNRWVVGLLIVLIGCGWLVSRASTDPNLLQDSDTRAILAAIESRQAPMSWFGGDWPLGNHFYRPVSTLAFELDAALHPGDPAGFARTNAILCALCVLALFWFLREFTDRVEAATGGALLFVLFTLEAGGKLAVLAVAAAALSLAMVLVPGRGLARPVASVLVWMYLVAELAGSHALAYRMMGWIPGRTASVMTLFCLLALASFCRHQRLCAPMAAPSAPSPLDPPATRSTGIREPAGRWAWTWGVAGLAFAALAFVSYEQAVMLPAVMVCIAIGLRWKRFLVSWSWVGSYFVLLAAYLVLRQSLLPQGISGYQDQQFRAGPGVAIDLVHWLIPAAIPLWNLLLTFEPLLLMTSGFLSTAFSFVANGFSLVRAATRSREAVIGLAASFLAFLPMAWLKPFDHYAYWPMALRTLFVIGIFGLAVEALLSAVSRPTIQAPARPDPAPGSLPHP